MKIQGGRGCVEVDREGKEPPLRGSYGGGGNPGGGGERGGTQGPGVSAKGLFARRRERTDCRKKKAKPCQVGEKGGR